MGNWRPGLDAEFPSGTARLVPQWIVGADGQRCVLTSHQALGGCTPSRLCKTDGQGWMLSSQQALGYLNFSGLWEARAGCIYWMDGLRGLHPSLLCKTDNQRWTLSSHQALGGLCPSEV